MREIVLSDADIQSIINGRDVIKQSGETKIKIRQSYLKDAAMPVIKDRYNIADSVTDKIHLDRGLSNDYQNDSRSVVFLNDVIIRIFVR